MKTCNWSIDNWLSLWSTIVAGLGVITTSIFSYLLYRVTIRSTKAAESSARAAEASTRIAENLEQQKMFVTSAMRRQLLRPLIDQSWDILTEIKSIIDNKKNTSSFFTKKILVPDISNRDISEFFTEDDRNIIYTAWNSLNAFLDNYWEPFGTQDGLYRLRSNSSVDEKGYLLHLEHVKLCFDLVTEMH